MECENVGDVNADPDYLPLNPTMNSECCVSLLNSANELLGVLALERERHNGFGEGDLNLIKMAARHISIAIERAKQSEDLEFKSTFAARTSWAANIAHEVYNKVGNILNWAYLIRKTAEGNSNIEEYARHIEESVRELSNAIPRDNAPTEMINLDEAIKSTLDQITVGRSVKAAFTPGAPDMRVNVNLASFQYIFRHLLNNAARAMNHLAEKKIFVSTCITEDKAEIRFEDNGPGISDDKRMSIFHRPFTTKQKGGGFGLLYVRQIVENMRGEIELLKYQEGRGAVFLIQFPVIAAQEQEEHYVE
ncbi:MAG: GAF domain-containing sensor histidine kinase [Anaerolineales bacterium]|nr:GAF domain-containing sensor histidine kinase [Anaerolineales bacterium]